MTVLAAATPSLGRRVLRASAITVGGYGASQAIRLASNLLLTRLLFPEAFGMMALISVVLAGLAMVTDVGLGPAILRSPRGDDPAFLDTAWTIQVFRGVLLWLAALAMTPLLARFYGEPALWQFLPVSGLTLLVAAFNPTRYETESRHLRAGSITLIELASQVASVLLAAALALWTRSVWALVLSGVAASLLHLLLLHLVLPGHRNRFRWEAEAAAELATFGRWIFLATLCGFAVWQADKAVLGKLLPLGEFGLYNIAWFLASVPVTLGGLVTRRVLIPVYRDSPPAASAANAARVRRLRSGALAALLLMSLALALLGPALVGALYDPRYHAAGGIVTLVAVAQIPTLLILTCDQAALAMGDSRRFFALTALRAVLTILGLLGGFFAGGLAGAIAGQGVAALAAYPGLAWLLKPHGAWDPRLDAAFLAVAAVSGAATIWLQAGALASLP